MVSMVRNTHVDQRDADNAVVIAITSRAFWSDQNIQSSTEPFGRGAAFPLIQAIQNVNKQLLDKNPRETQLFDVIMLSSDSEENQSRIIASTKHYGLEIGRFCFCSKEDTIDTLLSNRVNLFLSTDTTDVSRALQRGMLSALLNQHTADHSSEQLRVLFSGDALVGFSDEDLPPQQGFSQAKIHNLKAARDSIMRFATLFGEMKKKFGLEDSPISTSLLTVSSRDMCARALRTLRAGGLMVDETYCLAGAPRDPILSLVKPHIVFTDGL